MSKKRKTRKQKLLSDLHRKLYKVKVNTPVLASPPRLNDKSEKQEQAPARTFGNINKYPYLLEDISRTAIVTASIIAFQLLLFIILKFHVLKLPGISY